MLLRPLLTDFNKLIKNELINYHISSVYYHYILLPNYINHAI